MKGELDEHIFGGEENETACSRHPNSVNTRLHNRADRLGRVGAPATLPASSPDFLAKTSR